MYLMSKSQPTLKKKAAFALDMKAQRGMFIGPRAPFEYQKSEEEYGQIIPDSESAAIIKNILNYSLME